MNLIVYTGNKKRWNDSKDDCEIAEFIAGYKNPQTHKLLDILKYDETENTTDIPEEMWEGLDYDATTTLSDFKNAKKLVSTNDEKIVKFIDEVINNADTEKLYLMF